MSDIAPAVLCKTALEFKRFAMDFANNLAPDETISSVSGVTPLKVGGAATDLDVSAITTSGSQVLFWLDKGKPGTREKVEVVITTSGGSTLEGNGIITIT